jgi:hypothetical protein
VSSGHGSSGLAGAEAPATGGVGVAAIGAVGVVVGMIAAHA